MRYKIKDRDFFKQKLSDTDMADASVADTGNAQDLSDREEQTGKTQRLMPNADPTVRAEPLRLGDEVNATVIRCCAALRAAGFTGLAKEVEKMRLSAVHDRFTVAVVGEFSRGKSTFINRLLEKEFLPVGDLPATAVMTRIRYNEKEILAAFDEKNKKVFERPIQQGCWDGLVAQNFGGEEFKGTALAGVNVKWLEESNVELIDTPGAGDLSESRAKVIGDALLGCDGAIIATNANAPLSLSEKLFIEERLLARKIPFLMLIITKLDQVQVSERTDIIRYVKSKLREWNMEIPVFVPYPVELDEDGFDEIMGMERIKKEIVGWIEYPDRVRLTEQWVLAKTGDALQAAISSLLEQKLILESADMEKRNALIQSKKEQMGAARLAWGDLRMQMEKRRTACYQFLTGKVDEYAQNITERLQYEVSHTNNPQSWWKEDYPYRLKIELTNLAVGIENLVSQRVAQDAQWYCSAIEKIFHSHMLWQRETIADKELFGDFKAGREISFENLDKQRTAFKIGSAVLSVTGVALFSAMGFMPIVATMGVGTGTAIISDRVFRKKIQEQKEELKKELAHCVPAFIQDCLAESEERLSAVYQNIISEAEKSEQEWMEAQNAAISAAEVSKDENLCGDIDKKLAVLKQELNVMDIS